MKRNNYNKIAWCYDLLAAAVFGNKIKNAQIEMLNFISPGSSILIAGGGTGWILEEIVKIYPSGIAITYIDASEKMIKKSKKRYTGLIKPEFICKSIEQVLLNPEKYDVIISAFFFDNFTEPEAHAIFKQLHTSLKRNGVWLFTDFTITPNEKYWQKRLLDFMYFFFRVTCRVQSNHLFDVSSFFVAGGYKKLAEKKYYKNFILSRVFEKT